MFPFISLIFPSIVTSSSLYSDAQALQLQLPQQQNHIMKRTKAQHSTPITLSSKRQQDKYSTPNKTDWTHPLQSTDSNQNKSFFTHMKAELNNIKNDFERLIQKEEKPNIINKQLQGKSGWEGTAKGKSYSSYKQDKPILFDKYSHLQELTAQRDTGDLGSKPLNLWKNINEAVNFKNRHVALKEKETGLANKVIYSNEEQNVINLTPRIEVAQTKSKELAQQNQSLRLIVAKYQQQIGGYKQENAKCKFQLIKVSQQNIILKERIASLQAQILSSNNQLQQQVIAKVTSLQTQIAQKTASFQYLQREIVEKVDQIRAANQDIESYRIQIKQLESNIIQMKQIPQHENLVSQREQMEKERLFYQQKINELTFYNNNFYNDNVRLTEENHQLQQNIAHLSQQQQVNHEQGQQTHRLRQSLGRAEGENQHLKGLVVNLQGILENCKRMNLENERQYQKKLQFLQKDINEYEKREQMFHMQINELYAQIRQAQTNQCGSPQLAQQIQYLRSQLASQQQINQAITDKYRSQVDKLNIQQITQQLQHRISQLTDQNQRLKNSLNACESKVEELSQKCRSYSQQILLYEEREKQMGGNRSLSCTEWQEMTQRIEQLLAENRRLGQQRDFQQLVRQVSNQDACNNSKEESLVKVAKDQLQQITLLRSQVQELKTQIYQQQEQNGLLNRSKEKLQDQLRVLAVHNEPATASLLNKYDHLHAQLQAKIQTISKLKALLRQTILSRSPQKGQSVLQQIDGF